MEWLQSWETNLDAEVQPFVPEEKLAAASVGEQSPAIPASLLSAEPPMSSHHAGPMRLLSFQKALMNLAMDFEPTAPYRLRSIHSDLERPQSSRL